MILACGTGIKPTEIPSSFLLFGKQDKSRQTCTYNQRGATSSSISCSFQTYIRHQFDTAQQTISSVKKSTPSTISNNARRGQSGSEAPHFVMSMDDYEGSRSVPGSAGRDFTSKIRRLRRAGSHHEVTVLSHTPLIKFRHEFFGG